MSDIEFFVLVRQSKKSILCDLVKKSSLEEGLRNDSIKVGYERAWAPDVDGINREYSKKFYYKDR